jgi:hypothetical protein
MGLTVKILQTNDLGPAVDRAFACFVLYFYFTGLTITKNHFWESFILFVMLELLDFYWVWGLDMRFC